MNDILATAPVSQRLLFQRLRWRLLHNSLAVALTDAPIRVLTILFLSLLVWGVVFVGSFFGFDFLRKQGNLGPAFVEDIIATLFDLFFLALGVMLVFSTGIILYSSLFASAEAAFLLSTPARADQVFAYKYQGAIAFSSWAFVLLGSPILIAYGWINGAAWYFYALLPFFFLGFVLLPGSFGALVCLLVVNLVPKRRKQVLLIVILLLAGVVAAWFVQVVRASRTDNWTRDAVQHLLSQFAFARGVLIPSHWMTEGLQSIRRDLTATGYYLALIWSNGLFLYVITAWTAGRLYRRGHNRVATGGTLRRRYGGGWMDRAVTAATAFLNPQTRLLIVKDFRTFRRDPAQWAQILIFTGLLVLYFANTRRFYDEGIARPYKSGISLLNLAATATLLCAYTGRFIYPLLSLEGRKFWILGLLPLKRDRLLWGKFAFSATGSLVIAELLVVFSDLLLRMPARTIGLHVVVVAVLALGLSGLSVGLGAWMPNFRETDPSKIAIGFGGTLNLVTGLLFLIVEIALMALPWHLYAAAEPIASAAPPRWLLIGLAAGLIVGVAAVVVPLRLGARTLRRMEF